MKQGKTSTEASISALQAAAVAWSVWYWFAYMGLNIGFGYGWDWKRPENAVFYAALAVVQIVLTAILVVQFFKVYRVFFKGLKRRQQSEICANPSCQASLFRFDCSECGRKAYPLTSVSVGLLAAITLPLVSVGSCGLPNDTGPIGIMRAAAIIIAAALILWSIGCWLWNR